MAVDRTKPVTPLAVAIMHYNTVLMSKILTNWHELIRERGKLMRFRTRIFHVWKQWAPKHRQMRIFNDKAQELIRLKLVQRAYGVMIKLCFNVIGMRTEKIKELRRNFCDRRVVICAYALLHKVNAAICNFICFIILLLFTALGEIYTSMTLPLTLFSMPHYPKRNHLFSLACRIRT